MEVQRVHVAEDAVAGQDEVLRAQAVLAVLLSLQNQAELLQVRAALEGIVGDGADERRRVLARSATRVLVEHYFLQARLVREGVLGEGGHAARRVEVAVVVVAHVDGTGGRPAVIRLHVGVVNDVLLRVYHHEARSPRGGLADVGANLLAHTSVKFLGVVRAGAAPCLLGNESGGQRVQAGLLHGGAVPAVAHQAHLLVQAVHQLLLIAAHFLARDRERVTHRTRQQQEVFVAQTLQLVLGELQLVIIDEAEFLQPFQVLRVLTQVETNFREGYAGNGHKRCRDGPARSCQIGNGRFSHIDRYIQRNGVRPETRAECRYVNHLSTYCFHCSLRYGISHQPSGFCCYITGYIRDFITYCRTDSRSLARSGCLGSHNGRYHHQGYLAEQARQHPPRHVLAHHLRSLDDAARGGHVVVGHAALAEGRLAIVVRVIAALHKADVWQPVRVVHELGEAVARHHDLETVGCSGLHVPHGCIGHRGHLVGRGNTEDVVPRNHVLRAQRRPVVLAVLLVVEQAQLLQVIHACQCAVGDHHLQVGVGVLRVAGGLPELDVLHVRVAADGVAS